MLKVLVLTVLLVILVILSFGLRDFFLGDKAGLNRSLQLRVALSILMFVIIIGSYLGGIIEVSRYAQLI